MTDFGDWDERDAFDTEPPDPEQVAIKLHRLRLARGDIGSRWEELPDVERTAAIALMVALIAWLRRQGGIR